MSPGAASSALAINEAKILIASFTRQIVGEMNPGQHLIGVEVRAWFYVFRMFEQRGVKMHFIRKPLCSKEHR
jgi:hypothetical protein